MYLNEARKRGAKIVHIDVHRNRTSVWADEFIPIIPGTDTALALGIMHVLIREKLTDEEFIGKYAKGYGELVAQAELYPPERVAEITGIPADVIVRLACEYGNASPSFIRIGNGLQHHDNGGMAIRTIACLPALTGQWGIQGGGAIKGNSHYSAVNGYKLERPDLMPDRNVRSINMNRLGKRYWKPIPPLIFYSCTTAIPPSSRRIRTKFAGA